MTTTLTAPGLGLCSGLRGRQGAKPDRRKFGKQLLSRDEAAARQLTYSGAGARHLAKVRRSKAKGRSASTPGTKKAGASRKGSGKKRRSSSSTCQQFSRAQVAAARLGGHRAERVGEARVPGPTSLASFLLVSLNTGGPPCAWSAMKHYAGVSSAAVLALQETRFSPGECFFFSACCWLLGVSRSRCPGAVHYWQIRGGLSPGRGCPSR